MEGRGDELRLTVARPWNARMVLSGDEWSNTVRVASSINDLTGPLELEPEGCRSLAPCSKGYIERGSFSVTLFQLLS